MTEGGRDGDGLRYISRHSHGERVCVYVCRTHVGVGGHVFCLSATSAQKGG